MKHLLFSLFALGGIMASYGQQALWDGGRPLSPEINADNSVTFRLYAPEAQMVTVSGDFLAPDTLVNDKGEKYTRPSSAALSKDSAGLWSYTTGTLSPELYSYSFNVDGLRMLDPSNVYLTRDIATLTNIFIVSEPGSRAELYKVNDVPHGTVARVWYDSPTLGMKRRMSVYTPPGYEDSGESYPVFYLQHGAGGDEEAWLALGRAAQIMDNLIAQGKAEPMIVVMTNGNATQSGAPGEAADNMPVPSIDLSRMNRGEIERAFPDVINFIDTHYRTKADKSHRAIAGLSMGGFHSLHISKQYPELFDYVGLFSAAINPPQGATSEVYQDRDGKLQRQFDAKPALYWIAIGRDDFLYEDNVAFRELLDSKGYPYEYYETPEGHIWKNWRIYLSEFAPKLFKKD